MLICVPIYISKCSATAFVSVCAFVCTCELMHVCKHAARHPPTHFPFFFRIATRPQTPEYIGFCGDWRYAYLPGCLRNLFIQIINSSLSLIPVPNDRPRSESFIHV